MYVVTADGQRPHNVVQVVATTGTFVRVADKDGDEWHEAIAHLAAARMLTQPADQAAAS